MDPSPSRSTSAVVAAVVVALGALVGIAPAASAHLVPGHGTNGETVAAPSSQTLRAAAPAVRRTVATSLACSLVRGLRVCTHGDDAHLGAPATAAGEPSSSSSTASTRIGCYTGGPRVQAVYARPAGAADRYSSSLSSFRGWAGAAEKTVSDSASKTSGSRHVRFASVAGGGSCTLSVLRVTLPGKAFDSFNATVSALQDAGLAKEGTKYLVWADAAALCGVASTYVDDKPTADNLNNGRFPQYARIDRSCWGKAEAHELMHMLGAVQRGAPHATQGMHCNDGNDVMCYDDRTAGSRQTTVCPAEHRRLLDCRGDDYFSTAPRAGSWLATHWNTANSAFLARDWTDPAPAKTTPRPSASSTPAPRPSPSPDPAPSASAGPSASPSARLPLLPVVLPTGTLAR